MSTNFPTSLDSFTNPQSTDQVSVVDHASQHSNINDSVTALETKVGINGSAINTTHDYKLSGVATGDKATSLTGVEVLTNKKLSDSTTTVVDVSDNTKAVKFDVTGTTSVTGVIQTQFTTAKTLILPDASDTVVARNTTDTLTNKTISGASNTITNLTDTSFSSAVTVPKGGTGLTSLTAYAILTGGTTTTGNIQQVPLGSSGQVLTSNGAGSLPTFQTTSNSAFTFTGTTSTAINANDALKIQPSSSTIIYSIVVGSSGSPGDDSLADTSARQKRAQTIVPSSTVTTTRVTIQAHKTGTPADNLTIAIQADNAGVPSGTNLATGTISGGSLTGSFATTTFTLSGQVTLTSGTTYWFIFGRSGSVDAVNYYNIQYKTPRVYTSGNLFQFNGTTWSAENLDLNISIGDFSTGLVVGQAGANDGVNNGTDFIGFAQSAISQASTGTVILQGIVAGFTSLTVGSVYYLSDTLGLISTTPGTHSKKLGYAISTTQLFIQLV